MGKTKTTSNLNDALVAAGWTRHDVLTTPRIIAGPHEGVVAAGVGTNVKKYQRAAACAICFAHELELPASQRKSTYATGPLFDAVSEHCSRIVLGMHPPMKSLKVILSEDDDPDMTTCLADVIHEPIKEAYNGKVPDWGS